MRIIDSIVARYRNFKIKYWRFFPEGRHLASLRNIHKGRRCFIIGNGPSLRVEDLNRIAQNGDITFGFNRIYHIFDQTDWRPTYYLSQDYKTLTSSVEEINENLSQIKYIPIETKWYDGVRLTNARCFHIKDIRIGDKYGFSDDISRYVVASNTVAYTAMQFAVYMGIKDIYLIGVDHHFQKSMNSRGEIVVDPNAKDYFVANYANEKGDLYIPRLDLSTLTYISAKEYADAHGVNIFNATRGGKLEVFPRVDIDTLF
jgi:hypothetical protein